MTNHGTRENDDTETTLFRSGAYPRRPACEIAHYIVVYEGTEMGKKLEIGLAPIRVGRYEDNELMLADPFVSAHHCTIAFDEGAVWVTDVASTNGTFIDGERVVGRAPWPDSASLQIGNQVLRHEYHARDEMERSTRLANDIRHAADYVRSLLPPSLRGEGIVADWQYAPSTELGGDIFHYHWLDNGRLAFYLIDVCGHGIGAALHSVAISQLLRQQSLPHVDFARPGQVLAALNRALPMERYGDMYFTLWYGVYCRAERKLDYASGGHPPALLLSERGRHCTELATENPPVGVLEQSTFLENSLLVEPASALYLYSDGVYEFTPKTGDAWSCETLARFLKERAELGEAQPGNLYRAIRAFALADRFEDDFSLLRMEFDA